MLEATVENNYFLFSAYFRFNIVSMDRDSDVTKYRTQSPAAQAFESFAYFSTFLRTFCSLIERMEQAI